MGLQFQGSHFGVILAAGWVFAHTDHTLFTVCVHIYISVPYKDVPLQQKPVLPQQKDADKVGDHGWSRTVSDVEHEQQYFFARGFKDSRMLCRENFASFFGNF